jgi:DNA modification methylase
MLSVITGDCLKALRELPDESVHCCVTSPPYWGLRDYGTASWEGGDDGCDHIGIESGGDGKQYTNEGSNRVFSGDCKCGARRIDSQLGLEKTPEEYVTKMVEVFREVKRVLRKDGTLWLNLGDSYAGSWKNQGRKEERGTQRQINGPMIQSFNGHPEPESNAGVVPPGLKPKDLCGIPWKLALALQADGWWLRQDIIWAKPNPMPESVTDRCTKSHEYLFLLTKSARYFYDAEAIREPNTDIPINHRVIEHSGGIKFGLGRPGAVDNSPLTRPRFDARFCNPAGRNKRSVWTVATAPYPEAHFATYPPDLIKPCILAGTSAKGCCANCGAPWERVVETVKQPRGNSFGNRSGAFDHGQAGSAYMETVSTKTTGWQPTCKCNSEGLQSPNATPGFCTVLDPFAGSGTTGQVALELGRKAILIELNPKYVELIRKRCDVTPGLALA